MVDLQYLGVARSLFFAVVAFLFCLQIASVSPTGSSPGVLPSQTSQGSQEKTKEIPTNLENSNLQGPDNGSDSVNPAESWNFFRKRGGKGNKGKKEKHSKENSKSPCEPSPGLPGPPGPPGPAGPPGAQITEATMMAEFRSMVQESANRRSRRIADQNISLMAAGIPDLLSAHHIVLRYDVTVPKKSHQELKNYKLPGDHSGTFVRGNDIDLRTGRYVIRYTGIYQLTAHLVISRDREANLRPRDYVKISVCISSLCELNTSLTTITGMESNSLKFTVSVTGMLMLKAGHYVSIYIENNTNKPISILEKSSFSGLMIGR
ncbi:adipolin-like isoform X1 [Oculina patagonica]